MKGYKAFNKDLSCKNFQYEIGKTYEMEEKPICCQIGFHFCKNIAEVYKFYPMSDDTRICEVSAIGDIVTDDDVKFCTNKIKIVREIKSKSIKHCNTDKSEIGYCNTGFRNSGDYNSGNYNSGYYNSGNCNSGSRNSGFRNSGDFNSGDRNSGDYNSGDYNSGNYNSGDYNSGDYNSGNYNSGNYNSGDYNSGDYNSGFFNTTDAKVRLFNHETDLEFNDYRITRLNEILQGMPQSYSCSDFIKEEDMTEKEKENHPEYKTIGGYIKNISVKADKWKWWKDDVSEEDKEFIKSLPYYDEEVFFESTGISKDKN